MISSDSSADSTRARNRVTERAVYAGYINFAVGIAVSFLLTPMILSALGPSQYGFWTIINSVGSYLLLADFGLGTAVTKYTAEYSAKEQQDTLNGLISAVLFVFSVMSGVLLVGAFAVVWFVPAWFGVEKDLAGASQLAFVLVVFSIGLSLISSVFANVICGHERVDIAKTLATVLIPVNGLLTVISVKAGLGVVGLALVSVLTGLAGIVLYGSFVRRSNWGVGCLPRPRDVAPLNSVWPYSLRTLSLGLTSRVLYQTDSIVIGVFLGAGAVTPYAIAYRLCFMATYAFSQLSTTMFPTFARLYALEKQEELAMRFLVVTRISVGIMSPIAIGLVLCGPAFIDWWVGHDAFVGLPVLLILVAMDFVHAVGTPAGILLQSIGRNKAFMYSEIINAILNLTFSIVLVRRMGVAGVALGTLLAHLCTSSWLVEIIACRSVGLEIRTLVLRGLAPPLLAAGPALVAGWLVGGPLRVLGLAGIVIQASAVVATYAPVYLLMSVAGPERRYVCRVLRWIASRP